MRENVSGFLVYLFDIDGTILLTGGAGTRAFNRVFRERYGIEGAMDHVRPGGKTDPIILGEIFERAFSRAPDSTESNEIFTSYVPYLEIEVAQSNRFQMMPGAAEAVRHLAGLGVTLGVGTGNIRAAARIKLSRPGLWDLFDFGGFGDDSADRADLIACAIGRARASAPEPIRDDEFVVVGDTPHDISAARACGARVVAVPTGGTDRDTLAALEPDAVLDTLEQLPAWHAAHSPSP
jgi:phosphoglycolate phosphatase-like HAD superfamily hydrolase